MLKFLEFLIKRKLKKQKVYIRKNVKFKDAIFGGNQKIGVGTNIKNSSIDFGSYIGKNCSLESIKIGKYCSLGNNIKVIGGTHPLDYISTHPFSHSLGLKKEGFDFKNIVLFNCFKSFTEKYVIEIENDVWIGDNVLIMGGIKIGNGAVIGAGAVITKNVEPYSVVCGVPGKIIKYRFSKDEIKLLEDFKWWNNDISWLEENVNYFENFKKFKEIIN